MALEKDDLYLTLKNVDYVLACINTTFKKEQYTCVSASLNNKGTAIKPEEIPHEKTAINMIPNQTMPNDVTVKIGATNAVIKKETNPDRLYVEYNAEIFHVDLPQSNLWKFTFDDATGREWGANDRMRIEFMFEENIEIISDNLDIVKSYGRTSSYISDEIRDILSEYKRSTGNFISSANVFEDNLVFFFYQQIGDREPMLRLFKAQFKLRR